MLIGAAGAGKTHFKHLILRLPPPAVRESTPLAEAAIRAISIDICQATISDGDRQWQRVSSEELLRMVVDAIKAGVPVRILPLAHFPVRVLPLNANYSDLASTTQIKNQMDPQHSLPLIHNLQYPLLRKLLHLQNLVALWSLHADLSNPSQMNIQEELIDLISQSSGSRKLFDFDWVYIVFLSALCLDHSGGLKRCTDETGLLGSNAAVSARV